MQDTISQRLAGIAGESQRYALLPLLKALGDRFSSQATTSAGLVITATAGTYTAKVGAVPFAGVVQGTPVAIAAGTDMPTPVGVITAASFNVFCWFIDRAGNLTVAMGIEGTTLAKVKFPSFPEGKTLVGYIVVTYASTFTGGSTALGTATTVYVSPVGAFDPTISL